MYLGLTLNLHVFDSQQGVFGTKTEFDLSASKINLRQTDFDLRQTEFNLVASKMYLRQTKADFQASTMYIRQIEFGLNNISLISSHVFRTN